jgi:hypothetical protein
VFSSSKFSNKKFKDFRNLRKPTAIHTHEIEAPRYILNNMDWWSEVAIQLDETGSKVGKYPRFARLRGCATGVLSKYLISHSGLQ